MSNRDISNISHMSAAWSGGTEGMQTSQQKIIILNCKTYKTPLL